MAYHPNRSYCTTFLRAQHTSFHIPETRFDDERTSLPGGSWWSGKTSDPVTYWWGKQYVNAVARTTATNFGVKYNVSLHHLPDPRPNERIIKPDMTNEITRSTRFETRVSDRINYMGFGYLCQMKNPAPGIKLPSAVRDSHILKPL